jgi:hypothetical protein
MEQDGTIVMTGISEVSEKAHAAILAEGGEITGHPGNYRIVLPQGSQHGETSEVSGWRPNESSIKRWTLPGGQRLRYSTDWEDQKLMLAK